MDKRRPNLFSFGGDQAVEEEKKRKREKKKKKKRRRREEKKREEEAKPKRYGTTWNPKVLYEFPCFDGY